MSTKIPFKAGNMLYPLPVVMVSCGSSEEEYNIITVAWTGTINTNPPMLYISVRPERHSYSILKNRGEFVVNLTNEKLAKVCDFNGVKSGKHINKFSASKLTPIKADLTDTVLIGESPVNIECKVKQIIALGSHDMFIAEVVNVLVDEEFLDKQNGTYRLDKTRLISYSHGHYYALGKHIGHFGFSVRKKKPKKRK